MKNKETLLTIIAYLGIITIWSTTPLAIKWSTEEVGFITGVSIRMFIGTSIAVILAMLWHKKLPLDMQSLQVYIASSLGIYAAMMCVYWSAQYISSGLISVIFGLTPLMTSIIANFFLVSEKLTINKVLGICLGFTGLIIIFIDQIDMPTSAILGIIAAFISVTLHSTSAVWIKKLDSKLPALQITAGGLAVSLPLFIITFLIFSQPLPENIANKTLYSIIYLGIMGSVVGYFCYYYVLSKLATSTVALVTLITPITALLLGKTYNNEIISSFIWYGTVFVLIGLVIHQKIGFKLTAFKK